MNIQSDFQHLLRIVTLGESSVGKTSIINRLMNKSFDNLYQPTVGATFVLHEEYVDDNKVEMQIWDTAGQEQYKSLSPIYCRNAAAAIIIFDITNHESFLKLDEWLQLIKNASNTEPILFIAANKSDLIDSRKVSEIEMNEYSTKRNIPIFYTSAKNGDGIDELFQKIAKEIVDKGFVLPVENTIKKNETNYCFC